MIALRTKEKVGPVIRAVYRPETNDYVWLNIISIPLFIEGNEKPIEVYSTFEDITEKVANEKQLQESEENYRLLSTQMQLGLAVHEMIYNDEKEPIDYRFININPSFEHLTGLKKEHIIGKTVKDVLPETEDFWIQSYGRITKTGKPERFENYSNVLKRFYSVSAYSYKKDHFATIIEDITERKNNEIEREYLITHDHLTGLKNRRYFDQQVKLMDLQENYPLSIISFDINGLKIINDAFGHIYGDMLLKHVANVFLEVFQENCVVSRVGGDEFLILMIKTTEIKAKEKADEAQERIHEHRIKGVQVSLSYGIAVKNKNEKVSDLLIEAENKMYTHKLFETASHRSDSIKTILRALHEKNPREEIHSKRVSELCVKMGTVLKMDQNELQMLRTISHLHDIGKISIDDSILNKPGKLSNEEWEIIRKHPEIGFRIVSASKEYAAVGLDILSHHERYDGKGYPRGLANHEIPIRARIISLVDAYDAMTSDRPYRQAMTHQMAIEEIIKCANTQFDPTLVDVFVGLFKSDGST
jgi:diguanylate cyclase (GGDEF)-like protein/PAS domain S-box-containing protein